MPKRHKPLAGDKKRNTEYRAWALRMEGKTHQAIAEEIGVERSTVTKALKRVADRMAKDMGEEFTAAKTMQVEQLMTLADKALQAWEASQQPKKSLTKERSVAISQNSDGTEIQTPIAETVTSVIQDSHGDIDYLKEARAALADIRRLLGLEVKQTDITSGGQPIGPMIYLPPVEDE